MYTSELRISKLSSMAPPLWYLPVVVALLTQVTTPAVVHGAVRPGDCPDKCGNVTIPYPFGIGEKCSWPGQDRFVLRCDEKSQRPFVGDFEVLGITLETGEMLVNNDMTEACREQNKGEGIRLTSSGFWSRKSPFLVSAEHNEFTAIGCNATARMSGRARGGDPMITGCITYCASIEEAAEDSEPCTGLGCCKASIATGISGVDVSWSFDNKTDYDSPVWQYNPCMYAFVAKKGWYNFSRTHLTGFRPFAKEVGNMVPLVLDWAIRDGLCPTNDSEAKLDYACVSTHSDCVNTTNGKGYFCKCSDGYNGNPYILDNCTNINECMQGKNPCKSGTCHDTDGGYECKCKFGQKGDGTSTCQPILPWPAAAAIGITIVISLVAVALIRKRMKDENRKLRENFNRNGGQLLKNISIFTKENLDKITKNFSKTIGKGSFGQVYEGTTDDKQRVAVKRSIEVDAERQKDFANEITIQSKISHKNLVRLIGCCLETDVPMLVYEFIDRGSLYDMLHGGGAAGTKNDVPEEKQILPLQVRLDISIGTAEALAYMHSSANQKILHGDVKSGNILLHKNFSPKISDFGTSRLLSLDKKHTQFVVGDMGYIDPVYLQTGLLTEKSDVYSFGVVLLELITRKKTRYDNNNSLRINFVKSFLTESKAREMFDQEVLCTENLDCLVKVGGIAVQCLQEDVDERPTMMKVLEDLGRVRGEFAC